MKKILLLSICFFLYSSIYSQNTSEKKIPFSWKTYGNIANFFGDQQDMQQFFEFRKGDVVAEVGALDGSNITGFALLADSLTLYAQDINSKTLNQRTLNKLIRKSSSRKKSVLSSSFHLCIGTEKETLLPDNAFDKIILSCTFHELFYMDEMISDMSRKLKPEGKIYILEAHCHSKNHRNYTLEEAVSVMKKHNFHPLKVDQTDRNGGTGVYKAVFEKVNNGKQN